jgi:hypothetical protein
MRMSDVFIMREALTLDPKRAAQVKLQVELFGHTLHGVAHIPSDLILNKSSDVLGIADMEEDYGDSYGEGKQGPEGVYPPRITLWTYKHWRKVPDKQMADEMLVRQLAVLKKGGSRWVGDESFKLLIPITPWSKQAAQIAYDDLKRKGFLEDYELPPSLRPIGFASFDVFYDWDPALSIKFGQQASNEEVLDMLGVNVEPWDELEAQREREKDSLSANALFNMKNLTDD